LKDESTESRGGNDHPAKFVSAFLLLSGGRGRGLVSLSSIDRFLNSLLHALIRLVLNASGALLGRMDQVCDSALNVGPQRGNAT